MLATSVPCHDITTLSPQRRRRHLSLCAGRTSGFVMNEDPAGRDRYQAYRENFKATFELSGDYAKWFISTLLLLNSGAVAGIFQHKEIKTYVSSVSLFGVGIILALLAGLFGWLNLQIAARHYRLLAKDTLNHTAERSCPKSIVIFRWVATAFATLSVVCLAVGAMLYGCVALVGGVK